MRKEVYEKGYNLRKARDKEIEAMKDAREKKSERI